MQLQSQSSAAAGMRLRLCLAQLEAGPQAEALEASRSALLRVHSNGTMRYVSYLVAADDDLLIAGVMLSTV